MRTNLKVPFKEKDTVRRLGAKWDNARKTWFIEDVDDIKPFLPWIDEKLKQPTKSEPLKHPKFKKPKRKR